MKLNADGISRNFIRFKREFHVWVELSKPRIARLVNALRRDREDVTHAYADQYVEQCRDVPYLIGHIDMIVWPLAIIETIALLVIIF